MDSVREEVRGNLQLLQSHAFNAASNEKWRAEMGDELNTRLNYIMSAFKRASDVVIKELEWERVKGASDDGDAVFATCFGGLLRYEMWESEHGWTGGLSTSDGAYSVCSHDICGDTLEAAKAACQAHLVQIITSALEPKNSADNLDCARSTQNGLDSAVEPTETPDQLTQAGEGQPEATQAAVEPSCVVTDEMVRAGLSAAGEVRHGNKDWTTLELVRAVLTAALPSRTEEEAQQESIGTAAQILKNRLLSEGLFKSYHAMEAVTQALGWERAAQIEARERSLTNGGG